MGGQRFGTGNDPPRSIERYRVGKSASRVETDPDFLCEIVRDRARALGGCTGGNLRDSRQPGKTRERGALAVETNLVLTR
jgi:hypothetical protein